MQRDDEVRHLVETAMQRYLLSLSGGPADDISEEVCEMDEIKPSDSSDDPLDVPIREGEHGVYLGVDTKRRSLRDIASVLDAVRMAVYSSFRQSGIDFKEVQLHEPGDYSGLSVPGSGQALFLEVKKDAFGSIFHPSVAKSTRDDGRQPRVILFNGLPSRGHNIESVIRHCLGDPGCWSKLCLAEVLRLQCERVRHANSLIQIFDDPSYSKGEAIDLGTVLERVARGIDTPFKVASKQEDPWDYRETMFIVIDYHQDGDERGNLLTNSPFSISRIAYESTPIDFCRFL